MTRSSDLYTLFFAAVLCSLLAACSDDSSGSDSSDAGSDLVSSTDASSDQTLADIGPVLDGGGDIGPMLDSGGDTRPIRDGGRELGPLPDGSDGGDQPDMPTSGDTFERPIQLVFKIHIEPQNTLDNYRRRRDDVEAVRVIAEDHGALLTLHGNGGFWQYAAQEGDVDVVRAWLAAGHDVGLHQHSVHEDPDGSGTWSDLPTIMATEEDVRELWDDHEGYLTALVPELEISQATPYNSLDDNFVELMEEYGYEIVGGGRHEISVPWFGHHPFHPFRIGDTYLEEDLNSPVLMVHHQPQITGFGEHGPPGGRAYEDQTIAHLKVQFLQVYLNRMYAERTGQPDDRVWMFGFLTHDTRSDGEIRTEIDGWLDWLTENFGDGQTSLRGNQIVEFATFSDVAERYDSWATEHPGTSSFHVDTPEPTVMSDYTQISDETSRNIYPHEFWGMAQLLAANEQAVLDYVQPVSTFESDGVSCHELEFGPRDNTDVRDSRWLCWKESDGPVDIDVSGMVGDGMVRLWNVRDMSNQPVSAAQITVAAEPVLLERLDAPIN